MSITLKPGDYVSTKGMNSDTAESVANAFINAGAKPGHGMPYTDTPNTRWTRLLWNLESGRVDRAVEGGQGMARELTIAQVLKATNAQSPDDQGWIEWHGGKCPVERGTLVDVRYRRGSYKSGPALDPDYDLEQSFWTHLGDRNNYDIIAYRLHKQEETITMSTIDNLKAKRQARDEAEAAYQDALRAVRDELGDGFTLEDNAAQEGSVRDLPPEEWREGDLVECVDESIDLTPGSKYEILCFDSDHWPVVRDDAGDEEARDPDNFRLHTRP